MVQKYCVNTRKSDRGHDSQSFSSPKNSHTLPLVLKNDCIGNRFNLERFTFLDEAQKA